MLVEHGERLNHVAHPFAHLAAFLVQNQAQADDVLVRRLACQQGGQRVQAVEPATGLVDRLANVVGGEPSVGLYRVVVEGVMPLGKWHRTRVEPGVHDLWNAVHGAGAAVCGAVQDDVIHVGTVQVKFAQVGAIVQPR